MKTNSTGCPCLNGSQSSVAPTKGHFGADIPAKPLAPDGVELVDEISTADQAPLEPWPPFSPVLIDGAPILSPKMAEVLSRPLPALATPKQWLEAKAIVGGALESVREVLSHRWGADPARQARMSALVGAKKSMAVLKEHSGRRDRQQIGDWTEKSAHEPASSSCFMRGFLHLWMLVLLGGVFFASVSNGAKLVLLSKHPLFATPGSALLLSAIFSIAPVIIYEWAAQQLSARFRRRLDRVLQVAAVPCVLAGLGVFALSFGNTAQDPILSIANGIPPEGPNWGWVILANLVVEMFAEIGLWSGLRRAVNAPSKHSAGGMEADFKSAEIRVAELEALDARLSEMLAAMKRDENAWIESGLAHFEAKRAMVVAEETLVQARAKTRLAKTALDIG